MQSSNSLSHVLWSHLHHQPIAFFKNLLSRHLQSTMPRLRLQRLQLRSQSSQLSHQIPSVFWQFTLEKADRQFGNCSRVLLWRWQHAGHSRVCDDIRPMLDDVIRSYNGRGSIGHLRLCIASCDALNRRRSSQGIQHLTVQSWIGELRCAVVVIHKVISTRGGFPLLPAAVPIRKGIWSILISW